MPLGLIICNPDPHTEDRRFILHDADLTDSSNLVRMILRIQANEIYNLTA
jgi:GDPmannose 4,6-dehydratase